MSIKAEMRVIRFELDAIIRAAENIQLYCENLQTFNPIKVGSTVPVNFGYTQRGIEIVVEETFLCSSAGKKMAEEECRLNPPKYFASIGRVKKKDGELSVYQGYHVVKIEDCV